MIGIEHFTEHEAEVGLFHAWRDGVAVGGPMGRHLECGLLARFRAGLSITRNEVTEGAPAFGEWRAGVGCGGPYLWTVETSAALAAVFEDVQLSSFLPPGAPMIVVVRFFSEESGRWRVFQFHDVEMGGTDAAEQAENMMQKLRFEAGWMEEFKGAEGATLPPLEPRMRGVIEWRHLGRRVPCWYYDPEGDEWEECPENVLAGAGEAVRYVTLETVAAGVKLSYLAARTGASPVPVAGMAGQVLGWSDARVMQILDSGFALEPGWQVQAGAVEPVAMPESGREWDHPRVVFRFLGRVYATVAHGLFCVGGFHEGPVVPLDFPLRIGRLVMLPEGAWVVE